MLESHVYFFNSLISVSANSTILLLVWSLVPEQFKSTTRTLNCKSGTLLVKRASRVSPAATTEEQLVHYLSMILLDVIHLLTWLDGSRRLDRTVTPTLRLCWSETNQTKILADKLVLKRVSALPGRTIWFSWRRAQRQLIMLRTPFCRLQLSSTTTFRSAFMIYHLTSQVFVWVTNLSLCRCQQIRELS